MYLDKNNYPKLIYKTKNKKLGKGNYFRERNNDSLAWNTRAVKVCLFGTTLFINATREHDTYYPHQTPLERLVLVFFDFTQTLKT